MSRANGLVASFASEIRAAAAEVASGVFPLEKGDEQVVEFRADPFERCAFPNERGGKEPKGSRVEEPGVHGGTEVEGVGGEKSFS